MPQEKKYYHQEGGWRFYTEEEMIANWGENFRKGIAGSFTEEMEPLLGRPIFEIYNQGLILDIPSKIESRLMRGVDSNRFSFSIKKKNDENTAETKVEVPSAFLKWTNEIVTSFNPQYLCIMESYEGIKMGDYCLSGNRPRFRPVISIKKSNLTGVLIELQGGYKLCGDQVKYVTKEQYESHL